jgi:hypothetical protein
MFMYDLRESKGSFKGIIGECMFKETRRNLVLPKFFNRDKYFFIFGKYLSEAQADFLRQNWHSVDGIELSFERGKRIILYEVKTKNEYKVHLGFKPKMTLATHTLYQKAKSLGFVVKLAIVHFHEDWNYSVTVDDLNPGGYCIDAPKKYDVAVDWGKKE